MSRMQSSSSSRSRRLRCRDTIGRPRIDLNSRPLRPLRVRHNRPTRPGGLISSRLFLTFCTGPRPSRLLRTRPWLLFLLKWCDLPSFGPPSVFYGLLLDPPPCPPCHRACRACAWLLIPEKLDIGHETLRCPIACLVASLPEPPPLTLQRGAANLPHGSFFLSSAAMGTAPCG